MMPSLVTPAPDTDLTSWDASTAREECFAAPPGACRWGSPGTSPMARQLCRVIGERRRRDRRVAGNEDDLFQAVLEDVWKRFDAIWGHFLADDRPHTWSGFQRFLYVTLRNSLSKALRDLVRPQPGSGEASEPMRPSSSRLDERHLLEEAFRALSIVDREVLLDLHVRGRSTDESVRRLGFGTPNALFKRRHDARRRFRQESIRILGERLLRHPRDGGAFGPIVHHRCRGGHPCFLFKIDCRRAREVDALARVVGVSEHHVQADVDRFEAAVSDALAELGLPTGLDACVWESRVAAAGTSGCDDE